MTIKFGILDRILFGMPFHGLWDWVSNKLTLPNGSQMTTPVPGNGGVVLIRVPGKPAITRQPSEAADDTAAGKQWRNYALLSGGYYGGMGPLYANDGHAYVMFIDAAKKAWRMKIYTTNSYANYMTVSLQRFGVLGVTPAAWSPPINISCPNVFVASVNATFVPLMTVAQNTTGSEFVIGGVPTGSYANGLLKVTCTGTVDLTLPGRGLTFTTTTIDYQERKNHEVVNSDSVSGTCINSTVLVFAQRNTATGTNTGVTYTQTDTYTDGVFSSNGAPPAVGGHTWVLTSNTYSRSTTKTRTTVSGYQAEKVVWAGYVEDDLKLYTLSYSDIYTTNYSAVWLPNGGDPYGVWTWVGPQTRSLRVISKMGTLVVHDQASVSTNNVGASLSSGPEGLTFPASSLNGYSINTTTTLNTKATLDDIIANGETYIPGSPAAYVAKYFQPINPNSQRWASPLMLLMTRTRYSNMMGAPVYTAHSVWAPSGANVATSLPMPGIFATWQPVLDDLRVSSSPICWF